MSNKNRLYIGLYARGGQPTMLGLEDTYHWTLMVGPKIEKPEKQGVRYHAKETISPNGSHWIFETRETSLQPTSMLLVRIMIGKIEDDARLDSILRQVPVKDGTKDWNCVSWVNDALALIEKDGRALGTRVTTWDTVRRTAMEYCNRKKLEGRFTPAKFDPQKVPTYDLIKGRETTP